MEKLCQIKGGLLVIFLWIEIFTNNPTKAISLLDVKKNRLVAKLKLLEEIGPLFLPHW